MASRRLLLVAAVIFVARVTPVAAQTITEFPLLSPGSIPYGITAGPDGNLWFTEFSLSPKIGRITTAGAITEFSIPSPGSTPASIVAGSDGNLWFTQGDFDSGVATYIGRITPAGSVTRFPLPNLLRGPGDITAGPDGNLWFTYAHISGNKIGRITTAGVLTEFPSDTPNPGGITAGPDGSLWVTEITGNKIVRITTAGVISEFPIPTAASEPIGITAGRDGNLWFTEFRSNKIGRITTAGVITEFTIPTAASGPWGIAAGPDGNLWFTERTRNKIGRITTAGVITEFLLPAAASEPIGITAGPDDALWFIEYTGGKIGRITTGIVADPTQILPVVGSTVGAGGSFFRTSVQLHNAGTTPSSGRIVFHPSGIPGSDGDPSLTFNLAPGETRTIPDLLPAMERSGLGSADVIPNLGSAGNIPIVSARVFNDAGAAGSTGFALNAVTPDEALHPGRRGVLTIPVDLGNFRMNIGVRTLAADVLMTLTVRDASGAVAAVVPKFFRGTYHEQQAASVFLNGLPLPPGGSITTLVESGAVILYGATVDNRTGDPSLQIARPASGSPAAGKIAFVSSRDGNPEIYTINTDGTDLTRLTNDPAVDEEPAWSPDGQRIAFVSGRNGNSELYVMNADGSNVVRRTFSASFTENPSWSPDGTKIAYSTLSNGSANLWAVSPNAGGPGPTLLFEAPGWDAQPSWSPDGTRLALVSDWYAYDFVWDIFLINADGSGFTGLTGDIFDRVDYLGPSWSPNGARIAHVVNQRVGFDQYITTLAVMNADGTGQTRLISACSECGALISVNKLARSSWSPDGQVIAFTSGTTNALNVSWVKADGSASGLIVSNGWNPSWRPVGSGAVGSGAVVPVVGSTPGVGGSFFRTSVQLHNPTSSVISGRIVFHPSGLAGSSSDPAMPYTLSPGQTKSIADLLPAMGRSGLGSADIEVTSGSMPVATVRVFNDAGAAGTTGFALNALTPDEALQQGRRGVLTIPVDLTNFRMNIGVRTLAEAVSMTLTVRDAAGAVAAVVPKFFPATYHEQQAGSVFLNGLSLPPGGSITALLDAGSAILYGATVDNRTGDPSLQIAAPAP